MLCKDILFISERNIVRQDSFIIFLSMEWNKEKGEKKKYLYILLYTERDRSDSFHLYTKKLPCETRNLYYTSLYHVTPRYSSSTNSP